jgi:hypothetical protein
MNIDNEIADIFDEPLMPGQTIDELLEELDRRGRYDFRSLQRIVLLLINKVKSLSPS